MEEKVYDINKNILEEYDLSKGYLKDDEIIIEHPEIEGQEEEGHYETIREYENGGKDVIFIIDKEYIESKNAWIERIPIKVYIPYSEKELEDQRLESLLLEKKELLSESDYKCLKYVDGCYTEEEYQPIKEYRQQLRNEINEIEEQLYKI